MRRRILRLSSLHLSLWLSLWAVTGGAEESSLPSVDARPIHQYRVAVDDKLRTAHVRVQLGQRVGALQARDGDSVRLRGLKTCGPGQVRVSGNRIVGDGLGCIEYEYPLDASLDRRNPAVAGGVAVTVPAQWLWLPSKEDRARVKVEFSLPAGTHVSVPWIALDENRFEIPPSPGSSSSRVVFGTFNATTIDVGATRLQVALIDGPGRRLDEQKMIEWLRTAAADVSAVGGRFPSPDLQVLVQAVDARTDGSGRSAVPFGYVIRDGGESVRFFVDAERPLVDFLQDWTATHEFSHLLIPYVRSREKWISEGFASYYQNVLLARRGAYTEQEAWQRLHRAFQAAAQIEHPPALTQIEDRPFWEVRMLIYWSGAAIALLADTQLRELSGGTESLDRVLGRLGECCLPSAQTWQGVELFAKLDSLSSIPVFADLYQTHAHTAGMPDLGRLYTDLGIVVRGDRVQLRDDARLASIRQAIMEF